MGFDISNAPKGLTARFSRNSARFVKIGGMPLTNSTLTRGISSCPNEPNRKSSTYGTTSNTEQRIMPRPVE